VGAAAVLVAVAVLLPCQTQSTQADDELSATATAASSGTSADIITALRAENSALRAENLALRRSWAQCRAEDRGVPLAPLRRHLQAATCDLAGVAQAVNRACCPGPCGGHRRAQDDEPCSTVPEVCSADCAAVFMPFFESCHDELAASLSPALTASLDAYDASTPRRRSSPWDRGGGRGGRGGGGGGLRRPPPPPPPTLLYVCV